MNSCVLMAEIIKEPELRYTQEGQTPISEMLVQFPSLRAEDPVETLKVVGWGNLAQQIQEQFHQGDRVIIEGRLTMNTIDRPEGFKEKRAELTASRIHALAAAADVDQPLSVTASNYTSREPQPSAAGYSPVTAPPTAKSSKSEPAAEPPESFEPNYDDIPF